MIDPREAKMFSAIQAATNAAEADQLHLLRIAYVLLRAAFLISERRMPADTPARRSEVFCRTAKITAAIIERDLARSIDD